MLKIVSCIRLVREYLGRVHLSCFLYALINFSGLHSHLCSSIRVLVCFGLFFVLCFLLFVCLSFPCIGIFIMQDDSLQDQNLYMVKASGKR